jgi:hypothetical protein
MKFLAMLLLVAFTSVNSFASGKSAPRSDGYGSPQCRAYDHGKHEEHSPHPTCESCLSSGHGDCDMKCFSYDYTCTSKAKIVTSKLIIDPTTKQPREQREEKEVTYSATGNTEGEARDRAMQQCLWSNGYSACSLSSCNENSHEYSSQSCR